MVWLCMSLCPSNLYVEILSPKMMILEGGAFGGDQVRRALLWKRPPESWDCFCFSWEPWLIQISVLGVALEEENLEVHFLSRFWGFWNWLSTLIRIKDTSVSISNSKKSTDSHSMIWQKILHKISPMDTLSQTPTRSTDLSDPLFDTFKHFCQINEYKEIGWLFPMPVDEVRNGKDGIHIPSSSTMSMMWKLLCLPWKSPIL